MSRPRYRDPLEPISDPTLTVPDPLKVRVKSANWDGAGTLTGEDTTATVGYLLDSTTGNAQFQQAYGNIAIGMLAYASKTSTQSGITTVTDVTSLSVTWTPAASRLYKVSAYFTFQQATASGVSRIYITDSSNTIVQKWEETTTATSAAVGHAVVLLTPAAGSAVTYKVRATTTSGSLSILAASDSPSLMFVEDVGPAI